ncbi:hypothetical protein [uncultured Xanthomonas sp.]|uniref:hypothetical protein n=1 Tax=uncultured Xanthomonas sp. TaxID=152831 RepID=UPI0025DE42C4|nr:hypothetical protein [uncultured Xanthomonas sp.]
MNISDPMRDDRESGPSAIAHLLAYHTPLDGSDFINKVAAGAARCRQHRTWLLGRAMAMASATALAMRPKEFNAPPVMADLLHEAARIAGSIPSAGLLAMLLVITLCLGVSRAIDGI